MPDHKEEALRMSDEQFREFVVEFQQFVASRLEDGDLQFRIHQESIAENTRLTREVFETNRTLIEAIALTKNGAHVLARIGHWTNRLARWVQPILMVVGAIWALAHGHWPRDGE